MTDTFGIGRVWPEVDRPARRRRKHAIVRRRPARGLDGLHRLHLALGHGARLRLLNAIHAAPGSPWARLSRWTTIGARGWGLVLSARPSAAAMSLVLTRSVRRPLLAGMLGMSVFAVPLLILGTTPCCRRSSSPRSRRASASRSSARLEPRHAGAHADETLLPRAYSYDALGSFIADPDRPAHRSARSRRRSARSGSSGRRVRLRRGRAGHAGVDDPCATCTRRRAGQPHFSASARDDGHVAASCPAEASRRPRCSTSPRGLVDRSSSRCAARPSTCADLAVGIAPRASSPWRSPSTCCLKSVT